MTQLQANTTNNNSICRMGYLSRVLSCVRCSAASGPHGWQRGGPELGKQSHRVCKIKQQSTEEGRGKCERWWRICLMSLSAGPSLRQWTEASGSGNMYSGDAGEGEFVTHSE